MDTPILIDGQERSDVGRARPVVKGVGKEPSTSATPASEAD
jgi:hypothetical protein